MTPFADRANSNLQPEDALRRLHELIDAVIGDSLPTALGLHASDWHAFGKSAGVSGIAKDAVTVVVTKYFETVSQFVDNTLQAHQRFLKRWNQHRDEQDKRTVEALSRQLQKLSDEVDTGNPRSKASTLALELRIHDDQIAAIRHATRWADSSSVVQSQAAEAQSHQVKFASTVDRTLDAAVMEVFKSLQEQQRKRQTRQRELYDQLVALESQFASQEDHKGAAAESLRSRIEAIQVLLKEGQHEADSSAYENDVKALANLASLMKERVPPIQTDSAGADADDSSPQPPAHRRFGYGPYRWLLWAAFWVVVLAEQLVMNNYTIKAVQLTPVPQSLMNAVQAWRDRSPLMISHLFSAVFAFIFGCLPLVFSFGAKVYLDSADSNAQRRYRRWTNGAVVLYLGSLLVATSIQPAAGVRISQGLRLLLNLSIGVSLFSISAVLILAGGLVIHILFRDRALHDWYESGVKRAEAALIQSRSSLQHDLKALEDGMRAAEEELLQVTEIHGQKRALWDALDIDRGTAGKVIGAAAAAATAEVEKGYHLGVRVAETGIDPNDEATSQLPFEEFVERLQRAALWKGVSGAKPS